MKSTRDINPGDIVKITSRIKHGIFSQKRTGAEQYINAYDLYAVVISIPGNKETYRVNEGCSYEYILKEYKVELQGYPNLALYVGEHEVTKL